MLFGVLLLSCAQNQPAAIKGVNTMQLSSIKSDDPYICYNLGTYYYSQGEMNAAIKKLKTTIKVMPGHGEAHALLGLIYVKKGEHKMAEREFVTAAKMLPGINIYRCQICAFYKERGMACLLKNDLDQAIIYLVRSIHVNRDDEDAKQLLAFGYCLMADQCAGGNQVRESTEYYQYARMLYPALPRQREPDNIGVWPAWVQDNFPR